MTPRSVHLGFEVTDGQMRPSLARVDIPIRHMAVTGQTQESGKTTTVEALITRSGLPAIAFLTKRGEDPATGNAAWKELDKRGTGSAKPNVYRELDKLTEMGFLVKVDGGYQSVPGMKVTKNRVEAAA